MKLPYLYRLKCPKILLDSNQTLLIITEAVRVRLHKLDFMYMRMAYGNETEVNASSLELLPRIYLRLARCTELLRYDYFVPLLDVLPLGILLALVFLSYSRLLRTIFSMGPTYTKKKIRCGPPRFFREVTAVKAVYTYAGHTLLPLNFD